MPRNIANLPARVVEFDGLPRRKVKRIGHVRCEPGRHQPGKIFHGIGQSRPFFPSQVNRKLAELISHFVDAGDVVGMGMGKDNRNRFERLTAHVLDNL